MIIGNGLLANTIRGIDRDDVLFIASGVSNSKCTDPAAYERELTLIKQELERHPGKLVIFFSTYSMHDSAMQGTMYVQRKLEFEKYVAGHCDRHMIVRVSNLVGHGGNANNVFNFLVHAVVSGQKFPLWANATRNLIMTEDFARIMAYVLDHELDQYLNRTVDIINPENHAVEDIVSTIERFTGRKADYEVQPMKGTYEVDARHMAGIFETLGLPRDHYVWRILETHFPAYRAQAAS